MNRKIIYWESELEKIKGNISQSFSSLSEDELNMKLDKTTWSIAENLEHLIVVNESYYAIIQKIRAGTYFFHPMRKLRFWVNVLGNFILKSVAADRKRKMKTFSIWKPSNSHIQNIIAQFENHQQELIAFIKSCDDLLEKKIVIASPANKNILYTLEAAFDIIVEHEKRHYNQMLEVLKMRNSTFKS